MVKLVTEDKFKICILCRNIIRDNGWYKFFDRCNICSATSLLDLEEETTQLINKRSIILIDEERKLRKK